MNRDTSFAMAALALYGGATITSLALIHYGETQFVLIIWALAVIVRIETGEEDEP